MSTNKVENVLRSLNNTQTGTIAKQREAITSLRKANAKLRKELVFEKKQRASLVSLANERWEILHTWRQAHQQLADALAKGGR